MRVNGACEIIAWQSNVFYMLVIGKGLLAQKENREFGKVLTVGSLKLPLRWQTFRKFSKV